MMVFRKLMRGHDLKMALVAPFGKKSFALGPYQKAVHPMLESRVCILPAKPPDGWFMEAGPIDPIKVDDEMLLGLPFRTLWIESPFHLGPDMAPGISSIRLAPDDPDEGKRIEIIFTGAFLTTKMFEGVPKLFVQAVITVARHSASGPTEAVRGLLINFILDQEYVDWVVNVKNTVYRPEGKASAYATMSNEEIQAYNLTLPAIFPILGFLRSLREKEVRMGAEKVNERFKVGSGKGKQIYKIKEVVHIALYRKGGDQLPKTTAQGKVIDWSHRWEVMGHWRKVSGIGKDPSGAYGVQGFTWVSPHERGPENKPVVKKVRIVEGNPSKDQETT